MWFIGLVFKKTESLNIDLTQDIQGFTGQGTYYLSLIKFRNQVYYFSFLFFSSSSLSSVVQDGEGRPTNRCQTCQEETVEHLPTQQRHREEQAFDVFRQPERFFCSHNASRNVCTTEEESV